MEVSLRAAVTWGASSAESLLYLITYRDGRVQAQQFGILCIGHSHRVIYVCVCERVGPHLLLLSVLQSKFYAHALMHSLNEKNAVVASKENSFICCWSTCVVGQHAENECESR